MLLVGSEVSDGFCGLWCFSLGDMAMVILSMVGDLDLCFFCNAESLSNTLSHAGCAFCFSGDRQTCPTPKCLPVCSTLPLGS